MREDLQIGVDESGRYVVLVKQLVQCARIVKASAALNALATDGASLAQKLGHGDALQTATWGNNKQRTCDVRHVAAVLEWAVDSYSGISVLAKEQRACGGCAQGGVRSRSNTPRCDDRLHWR